MNEIEKAINCLSTFIKTLEHYEAQEEETKAMKIAIQALQEKLEQENPKPLGLEELSKMDGEPVWTMYFDGSGARWAIVKITIYGVCAIADCDTSYWFGGVHGPIAYHHKPKHICEAANMVEGE